MYETDFTFCASYKDWTSTSRELHKRMQYTQAKSHDSKGPSMKYPAVVQSSRGVKRPHYLELHLLPSLSS